MVAFTTFDERFIKKRNSEPTKSNVMMMATNHTLPPDSN
jgi:hypothetical protein